MYLTFLLRHFGWQAVMLSGESANSPYFEQAVHIMSRTVTNAEISRNYNMMFQSICNLIVNANTFSRADEVKNRVTSVTTLLR
jgi:pyruvate kinase